MRYIVTIILAILSVLSSVGETSDFQHLFKKIERTRRMYNRYNDSIATSTLDRDAWVHLFLERAAVNSRLYTENAATINAIFQSISDPTAGEETYLAFFDCIKDMFYRHTGDIFLLESFCEAALPFFSKNAQKFPYEYTLLNYIYGRYRYDIALISVHDDPNIAYRALLNAANYGHNLPDSLKGPFVGALAELSTVVWARRDPNALPVLYDSHRELDSYVSDTTVMKYLAPPTVLRAQSVAKDFRYNVLRNLHLQNKSGLPDAMAERLMDSCIAEYKANESLSASEFSHLTLFEFERGLISADTAVVRTLDYYQKHIRTHRGIDSHDLYSLHIPLLDLTYFNDISSLPDSSKRANARFIADEVCRLFRLLKTHHTNYLPSSILRKFISYKRLTSYLTTEEKTSFLQRLMVATQPATFAHSVHVGALAEIVIAGIEKNRPELLPSADTITDWKAFIREAALYHDLGKCYIYPVITNEYRPLSKREIAIIKTHPIFGISALRIDSTLTRFHDTTLGHHKWYDGKGGYPTTFNNTVSPLRLIIDVLTVCDCLEAATDLIGRNYSKTKHFDTIIEEMRQEGGTRYNPEILDIILNYPEVYQAMKESIEHGWIDIYYQIYENYIKNGNNIIKEEAVIES